MKEFPIVTSQSENSSQFPANTGLRHKIQNKYQVLFMFQNELYLHIQAI